MRGVHKASFAWIAISLLIALLVTTVDGLGAEGFADLEKQVKEFQLDNGLTFLVLERPDVPVFSFRTYVDVGGSDEVTGTTGIAHMFEHMAFKGTRYIGTNDYEAEVGALADVDRAWHALLDERRKGFAADSTRLAELEDAFKAAQAAADEFVVTNEFSLALEKEGAAGLNAMTSADFTQYFYNLPSNKLELWALTEGDRLTNPVLREFYKERDVVIEERRMGIESTPMGRLYEDLIQTAFRAHPYGYGVIGYRSDLESFTREDALEFYKKYYVAKNMAIAVVGDVKLKDVKKHAEKYFAGVSDAPEPPPVDTIEPEQNAEHLILMEDDAQPVIFIGYHMPGFSDPEYIAYDALSEVLGDGRSSRLYTSLVKEQKIAVQVQASTGFPGVKYPHLMFFMIMPASGVDPDDALAAFDAEIQRLLDEAPVTKEELDGIKTRYRARFWRRIQSNQGIAGQLAMYQAMGGGWRNLFKQVDRVSGIELDEVTDAAKKCFRKKNRTVAILRQPPEESS